MHAIFENGSHQYRVSEGQVLTIDRQPNASEDDELVFDKVLLLSGPDGVSIGTPLLAGASVRGRVTRQFRGKKILIRKFRRRKGYRLRKGHRQYYTTIEITAIEAPAS